ncbi:MAG: hypothetical protein COA38_10800 [Fluviicola sp.]|nr:MAG: hypothetical protein COA38_10800 [Fluviicola sp.]
MKSITELKVAEKLQLKELILASYPDASDTFINARIHNGTSFDIAMKKDGEHIVAACYYHVSTRNTPFSSKPIDIFHYGQALKAKNYSNNVVRGMGHWYARKYWSPFYMFKDVIGVSMIINPRVFEQFIQIYKSHLPKPHEKFSSEVLTFLEDYKNDRGMDCKFDEFGVATFPSLSTIDITDKWESHYKTKTEAINELFEEHGIIYRKNGKIYRSNKHLTCIGMRSVYKKRIPF